MPYRTYIITATILISLSIPFIGHVYGIYSFPAGTILDGSTGYIVIKRNNWFVVNVNGSFGTNIDKVPLAGPNTIGFLTVDINDPRYSSSAMSNRGFAIVNPIDAIRVRFGSIYYRL